MADIPTLALSRSGHGYFSAAFTYGTPSQAVILRIKPMTNKRKRSNIQHKRRKKPKYFKESGLFFAL